MRLGDRAAHPNGDRTLITRIQSASAHLGWVAATNLEPAVRSDSFEERALDGEEERLRALPGDVST